MRSSLVALVVLAAVTSVLLPGPARAQSAEETAEETAQAPAADEATGATAADDPGATPEAPAPRRRPREKIEEIVVQAGESDSAADLAAGDSVTGFDASDLEALGAQSIEDLAGFTPNLEIVSTGSTTPTFFIRGVGLNDFNPNSAGAVAIYQNDVPKNAPALQLATLFDVEAVNVLRGPQGTGPARNASAGAIKIYARRPTGEFGGYLRSEIGRFDSRDFEGAVEMPLFQDILSTRLAFRYSVRDGYVDNNCGRNPRPIPGVDPPYQSTQGSTSRNLFLFDDGTGFEQFPSVCGEPVVELGAIDIGSPLGPGLNRSDGFSDLPEGLPSKMNDRGNWAMRGTLRFQPTLDQDWLLTLSYAKRNQLAEVGQSIGTGRTARICDKDFSSIRFPRAECLINAFGSPDAGGFTTSRGYQPIELVRATNRLTPCNPFVDLQDQPSACADNFVRDTLLDAAELNIASGLVLDEYPFEGDYNRAGRVRNDTWGVSLKGDIALGDALTLTTITGYDAYDRFNDLDLDFTPNQLFEIVTDDEGWQLVQDFTLSGAAPGEIPVSWQLGAYTLIEELKAPSTEIFLPNSFVQARAVTARDWTQELYSAAGWFSFDWDFWDDFTLDGGVRYNWEKKHLDMVTFTGFRPETVGKFPKRFALPPLSETGTFQAPTGTIRLTYRFREDTHAYLKYTRGWKGAHYNVTVSGTSSDTGISTADPEEIDAFETGLRGSWLNGRLGLNGSLFYYAYRDYQIFTVVIPLTGTPEFQVLNASDAEVYGAELELTARPIPGMFLEARLGWLETQFLDFKQTQAQIRTVGADKKTILRELDFSGNSLLNSPDFKLSLTAEQTVPLGRMGSLTFRWDGAWSDETSYDASEGDGTPTFEGVPIFPENTIGQPAYWVHNFRLGYRTPDGSTELAAWVRNATDELYKTFAFDVSPIEQNATTIHFLGEPRTYGLSLVVNF